MKALSSQEVQEALATLPGWQLAQGKLIRVWSFADFVQAVAFVNQIAEMAEAAGHHPDIDIRYNRVMLGLVTHDANGITERDLTMAATVQDKFPQAGTPERAA